MRKLSLVALVLKFGLGLANATPPALDLPIVSIMGDSLSVRATSKGGYATYLQDLCSDLEIDTYGIGGQNTRQMVNRFKKDIVDKTLGSYRMYDDVIIFAGINDIAMIDNDYVKTGKVWSEERVDEHTLGIIERLDSMYKEARDSGMRVIAVTITPWGGYKGKVTRYGQSHWSENSQKAIDAINLWLRSKPENVDVVIDAYDVLEDSNRPDALKKEFTGDRLHLSSKGNKVLANGIYNAAYQTICSPDN
ncbi:MAG: GDSL-type esterase/lipase family protein [archaeon]|nr:GDSL-type esterase/lipase family protein [archaeon]